jgi:predicted acetyltransferase
MEIRKITPEERIHYSALSQLCFLDGSRWDVREALRNPPTEEKPDHGGRKNNPTWAAFENGKIISGMVVNAYTIRMNGHEVKMGGIGGVATRPEARGKGLIRRLSRPAFEEMRETGQVYSFLYPFSYEYYRKLGYELCHAYRRATIPIEEFSAFPYPDRLVSHEPEDSHEPFAKVYGEFARDRNLSVVRSEENWKWLLNRDPYTKLQFTYIHYDGSGNPASYVLYETDKNNGNGNIVSVRELCWTTPEGLRAIFGFFGKMSSEYKSVRWNVPDGLNIQAILPNPYGVEWATRAVGMNRIVDVPAVLAMHPAPAGSGRVTIGVSDAFCPENTGLYYMEWEGGQLSVKQKAEAFTNADMETAVTTLAQLTTGYLTPEEAQYRTDTAVRGARDALRALFPKKNLYLMERF